MERATTVAKRTTDVHVAVITGAEGGLSLSGDVAHCKAALLYADRVTLYSPRAFLLSSLVNGSTLPMQDLLALMMDFKAAYPPDIVAKVTEFQAVLASRPASTMTSPQRREFRRLLAEMDPAREQLRAISIEQWRTAGGPELEPALASGALEIDPITRDRDGFTGTGTDHIIDSLVARVGELLAGGPTYPLFDDDMRDLVRLGMRDGLFSRAPQVHRRSRDAGVAAGLVDRLPNFPLATMDEVISIRDELRAPLGRFRSGVRDISEGIEVEVTDEDFGAQVEEAWVTKVGPALDEIDQVVRTNSSLRSLAGHAIRDPGGLMAGGASAFMQVAVGRPGSLAAAVSLGVTGVVSGARALRDRDVALYQAHGAQFYFLHGANERMGSS